MPTHIIITLVILFGCMLSCYFAASLGVSQVRRGGSAFHPRFIRHPAHERHTGLHGLYDLPCVDAVVRDERVRLLGVGSRFLHVSYRASILYR